MEAAKRLHSLMPCLTWGSVMLANKTEHLAGRLQCWSMLENSNQPAWAFFMLLTLLSFLLIPLSTVVVGVLTLIKATQKAANYLQAAKNAPKETARLVEELHDLRSVLESYANLSKRLRETPDAAQTSTLRWLADLETESSPVARSSGELEKLIVRLEEK
ncbi:MAG: hypothetical protein Q9226_003011 [Calogaya cf. arnoldii]